MTDHARLIDVSSCNGSIDFAAIAAAGITGVYCRATLGTTIDSRLQSTRAGARSAGLIFGAYGVLVPGANAMAQAIAYIHAIGALTPTDLPPVVDFESAGDRPADAETWCAHVEEMLGRRCGLYSYRAYLDALKLPFSHPLAHRWLWLADYEATSHPPPPFTEAKFWQAFGDGGVALVATAFGETGIPGAHLDGSGVHVDRDLFEGSRDELLAWIASTAISPDWRSTTSPQTPSSKSSQRLPATSAPIVDDSPEDVAAQACLDGPATEPSAR